MKYCCPAQATKPEETSIARLNGNDLVQVLNGSIILVVACEVDGAPFDDIDVAGIELGRLIEVSNSPIIALLCAMRSGATNESLYALGRRLLRRSTHAITALDYLRRPRT